MTTDTETSEDGAVAKKGSLYALEIENFKSYKGLHRIGPFSNFTAVIGPNGSGKSNLMDAISFICGVRTGDGQLRGNLKELLYNDKSSTLASDHPSTGRVSLVFEHADGTQTHFTRTIAPTSNAENASYGSRYQIGKKSATQDEFNKHMLTLGVNVRARNFLVFQGDVQTVASQSPAELAQFFELVSGSDALKGDYEKLQAELAKVSDEEVHLNGKLKMLRSRVRIVKEAKEEAERFTKETQALERLRKEYFLWRLHQVRQDYVEAWESKVDHEAQLSEMQERYEAECASVSTVDQERAGLKKQHTAAVRKVEALRMERDRRNPNLVKVKEVALRVNRDLMSKRKASEQLTTKRADLGGELKKVTANAKDIAEALERAQEDDDPADGVSFTPEQRQEYLRLKTEADQRTCTERAALDTARQQLASDEGPLSVAQQAVDALKEQQKRVQATLEEKEAEIERAQTADQEQRQKVQQLQARLKTAQETARKTNTKRQQLEDQLRELENQASAHKSQYKATERERKAQDSIATMKERFGDEVLGRMTEIVSVKNQKHNIALAALMGRYMDSVVVRTLDTARQCVAMLKEERRSTMEFIPLNHITVPTISERLRDISGAHLAIDLMQFDRDMEPAVAFALGNALVADTQARAKQLAFEQSHKAAAIDGTIVRPNGGMSGGSSNQFTQRSTRWDAGAQKKVEEAIRGVRGKLEELPEEHEAHAQQSALMREVDAAKLEANSSSTALEAARAALTRAQEQADATEAELRAQQAQVAKLGKPVKTKRREVEKLQRRVDEIRDDVLRDFSARVGVGNIRQHEEALAAAEAAREERVSKLQRHLGDLRAEEGRVRNNIRELEIKHERNDEDVKKLEAEMARVEEKQAQMRGEVDEYRTQVEAAEAALDEVKARMVELNGRRDGAAGAKRKFEADSAAPRQELARLERELAALGDKCTSIEQDAMLTNVSLTERPAARRRTRRDDTQDDDDDDDEDDDGGNGGGAGPSNGGNAEAHLPAALRRDFSCVPAALRKLLDARAREKKERELRKRIEEMQGELDGLAPNMHAPAEYEQLQEQMTGLQQEIQEVRDRSRASEREFADVSEARTKLFNEAFEHISAAIDPIYKRLTATAEASVGGVAYLNCSQEDAPFDGGVIYAAIPPRKRYRDMTQLSGGEKTLAALALLLAMHSYKPAPFFVLDEIDAALDMSNLERVAMYIRECTRDEHPIQVQGIVISLKDAFFEKADALVGVTKRAQTSNSSSVFTFDLSRFEEPVVAS